MDTEQQRTGTAIPLAELAASWEVSLKAAGKSAKTVTAYLEGVRAFVRWHATRFPAAEPVLDRATASMFLADLRAEGAAANTARLRYSALRLFSRWLAEEGETDADQLTGIRPPKASTPIVPSLSSEQIDALLRVCRGNDFAAKRDSAMIRLAATTGLRAAEMMALTVSDVDLHAGVIYIRRGKGGKAGSLGSARRPEPPSTST